MSCKQSFGEIVSPLSSAFLLSGAVRAIEHLRRKALEAFGSVGKRRKASETSERGCQNCRDLTPRDAPAIGKHRKASESIGMHFSLQASQRSEHLRKGLKTMVRRNALERVLPLAFARPLRCLIKLVKHSVAFQN